MQKSPATPCWTDVVQEQKEEDDVMPFSDEDIVSPSEAKVEQMLCSKLAMDAIDMGTLPNADYNAWASGRLHKSASEYSLEERRYSNLSTRASREDTPSPQNRAMGRIPSLHRLRTSASMDKLDEMGLLSPRQGDQLRRSSNLSQVLSSLKKSPSMDFSRVGREETPPPPCMMEGPGHTLGPRRQSNVAVMRLIAENL